MKIHIPYIFLIIILIGMSTAPAFALSTNDNRNFLLIGIMFFSPIILLLYFPEFNRKDILFVLFIGLFIGCPLINHPESIRWSTILYGVMFCLTFMAYSRLLRHSNLTSQKYLTLLKLLLYAYTIVLLIQQFCVLFDLPIFNISNYDASYNKWKLNSLSAEPAHTARIVGLLMFSYIKMKEVIKCREYNFNNDLKEDKVVWLSFLWTMLTIISATAFLFLIIITFQFIKLKKLVFLSIFIGIMSLSVSFFQIKEIERVKKTFNATLTLNEKKIIKADPSASFRIAPIIICAKKIDLTSIDGWMGKGVDYTSTFLHHYMPVGKRIAGGGIISLILEYGLIPLSLFIWITFGICYDKQNKITSIILWFILVFMSGINSQIVWLCIILLYTNNFFTHKHEYQIKGF